MKKHWLILTFFIFAFAVRFLSVWPTNTIIGFDQARDLFDSLKILHGDLRIIGPTAGNNPNLHHGVAWLYFMAFPLLFSQNPIWVVLWNSFFNALASLVVFLLTRAMFNKKVGYLATIITAVSYYYVSFSGWLSNPSPTLLTVPLFFLGIWQYYKKRPWGLPLSMLAMGLSIQFELFFIYLIPVFILSCLILRPKIPNFKIFTLSFLTFTLATATMIATEIKFHFAGVKSLLSAGSLVGGDQTFNYNKFFALDLIPKDKTVDIALGVLIIGFFIFELIKNVNARKRNLCLLLWLFSPAIMLVLGTHNAPWFMIGRPAVAIIMGAYLISKLKPKFLIGLAVGLIVYFNYLAIKTEYCQGQTLLEPDRSSILSGQVAVMDYTYQKSSGQTFAIDTVTNPLYINAVWAWNYDWYYPKYGFKPNWLGGDQLPPYDTLPKSLEDEMYFFLIIDQTPRIPPVYTQNAIESLQNKAKYVEEAEFDGIKIIMWKNNGYKTNSNNTKSK
ncbi:MAG: glycosyltransferase family 39 protein [bacterium]|nr:glycosyltransferase family 39 protein [bacterium]